ncbi:MAG TPA: NADH-quinone oxidoreductase subunit NuoN [Burkholderiales bacterium]|nr:NADH-quinone oxidoreductase subunit NuoN [Burkholderiales bacterium]
MNLLDYAPVLPELLLLIGACALMIFDLYVKDEGRGASAVFAQVLLYLCAAATLFVELGTRSHLTLFNGLFVVDHFANLLKIVCYLAVSAAIVYSRSYLYERGMLRGEFMSLLLFALLGMMVLISAASFLTVFLGLELMSLCLYAMVALNRDSAIATEAAMKYFVLGALSSGLLLYGMSMVYGATGTLTITEVAREVARQVGSPADRTLLVFGLVFMVAGIAFKLGVVPFHMWIPDVYHGSPTPVTLIIGSGPKVAAFAMAVRLLVDALPALAPDWQQMLALLAILSIALGNITAIAQSNLKRMLAYSAIAHMGFMLLGLLSGFVADNWNSRTDAYSAAIFYMIIYTVMSVGAFGMLVYLSHAGFECENLEDLRGLNRTHPWYALLMLIIMFSLAGIPPTAGFYAKLAVFQVAVAAGHVWLAVAAVLLSLVGAFYYLRVVKLMYFDDPVAAQPVRPQPAGRLVLSANGLFLLVLGIVPQPLMAMCVAAVPPLIR